MNKSSFWILGRNITQVIARRIRECNVYSVILRYDTPAVEIAALKPGGIILSGGPSSVYAKDAPLPDKNIFALACLCSASATGAIVCAISWRQVEKGLKREYGRARCANGWRLPLFANLPASLQVWNSHGDRLTKLPRGFRAAAITENSDMRPLKIARRIFRPAIPSRSRSYARAAGRSSPISSTTFAGSGKDWTMRSYVEQASPKSARRSRGKGHSRPERRGGFERGRRAAAPAIGGQLACIFVNNGVLRAGEAEAVREVFGRHFKINCNTKTRETVF